MDLKIIKKFLTGILVILAADSSVLGAALGPWETAFPEPYPASWAPSYNKPYFQLGSSSSEHQKPTARSIAPNPYQYPNYAKYNRYNTYGVYNNGYVAANTYARQFTGNPYAQQFAWNPYARQYPGSPYRRQPDVNAYTRQFAGTTCNQCNGDCNNWMCAGCGGCQPGPAAQQYYQTYQYPYQREDAAFHDSFAGNEMELSGMVLWPVPKMPKALRTLNKKKVERSKIENEVEEEDESGSGGSGDDTE